MHRMLVRKGDQFEEHFLTKQELFSWFHTKGNVDQNTGRVQKEIVLFGKTKVKIEGDKIGWVFSDGSLDRDNEKIDPAGWRLDNYRKNPVILWAHDMYKPAIGRAEGVITNDKELTGSIVFDTSGLDPLAMMVDSKVRNGFLQTGSVGFMPIRIEFVEDKEAPETLIHREMELYEFSITNVPANVNARRREISLDPDTTGALSRGIADNVKSGLEKFFSSRGQGVSDYITELLTGDDSPNTRGAKDGNGKATALPLRR